MEQASGPSGSASVTDPTVDEPSSTSRSSSPHRLGRYVVLDTIGRGGMGVVYRAYDPDLDRAVAVKLLHVADTDAQGRLLREAQAMAKLSHPNVVPVYDVGVHEGRVFVAMDYVRGETLGKWVKGRPWREVLSAYGQAGRGLAAAHAAGFVHRDFKPDNCLVTTEREGSIRVQVLDFGLAKPSTTSSVPTTEPVTIDMTDESVGAAASAEDLTRSGAIMGTPAYMSPEQHRGRAVDARSDQFSFCVSLWLGVYGDRPFEGSSRVALARNVVAGNRRPVPTGRGVPTWLSTTLARGLEVDPDARFADMDVLLSALEPPESKNRGRIFIGAAVLAVAAAVGGSAWSRSTVAVPCQDSRAHLSGAWDEDRTRTTEEAFQRTKLAYADETFQLVSDRLDAWSEAWITERTSACEATRLHGTQSAEMLDLRMACLERRMMEFRALTDVFVQADAAAVEKAVDAAASLPPVEPCGDLEGLRAEVKPPDDPKDAEEVAAIRKVLADAKMLGAAGRRKEALALAEPLLERADSIDHAPTRARVLYRLGDLHAMSGDQAKAVELFERALWLAIEGGDEILGIDALDRLSFVVGSEQGDAVAGKRWANHALAVIARRGDRPAELSEVLVTLGSVEISAAEHDEAAKLLERAFALRADAGLPEDPDHANALNILGAARLRTGHYTEAKGTLERALALNESLRGSGHPSCVFILNNLALAHERLGELDEAIALMRRTKTLLETGYGARHPNVGIVGTNLGKLLLLAGRPDEAGPLLEEGVGIVEEALGPDHQALGRVLSPLGDHRLETGRLDEAEAIYARSAAVREKSLGPDHHDLAFSVIGLGKVALARKDGTAAKAHFERTLTLLRSADPDPLDIAEAEDLLGRALWLAGDRTKAETHFSTARQGYEQVGQNAKKLLAEHEAFLRANP